MSHPNRLKVLLLFSLAAGCGSDPKTAPPPDAPPDVPAGALALVSVALSPTAVVLSLGESQTLTVTGTFDDGSHSVITTGLTWETSAASVATVSASGVATAVAGGSATITVRTAALHAQIDVAAILRVFGDDYGGGLGYAPFGGSTNNPSLDTTDKHAGTTSLRVEVPSAGYTGGAFKTATPTDLSSFNAVTFWARASKTSTLNVVGFGNDAGTTVFACEWNAVPLTTTWTRFVVPIPDASKLTAEHGLFHEAEGADEGAYTLWLDDVQYERLGAAAFGPPSPAIATETVTRVVGDTFAVNGAAVTYVVGGVNETVATARRYFAFHSSDEAIATVDADGLVTAHAEGTATITAKLGTVDAIGALTFQVGP